MAAKKTTKAPRYTWGDPPVPVQSVTEVLSMLNKSALMPWAVKMTAEAFEDQMLKYYEPARCMFEVPDTVLPDIIKLAKGAYRAKSKEAMDRGTAVHDAIERYCKGELYPEQVADEDVRAGLQAFLDYGDTVELDIVAQEEVVYYHDGKEVPLYAGRFDMLASINGVLTLCDFKVAKDVYPEYWTQLNAYVRAMPLRGIKQVAILRIDKETGVLDPQYNLVDYRLSEAFIKLAQARKLLQEVEHGNH